VIAVNDAQRNKSKRRMVIVLFLIAAAFYFGFIAMTAYSS